MLRIERLPENHELAPHSLCFSYTGPCQAHRQGRVKLLGVAVTGANCFLEPGVRVTRKILDVAGLDSEIQVV